MANTDFLDQATHALLKLNTAMFNIQLYPATSTSTANAIHNALDEFGNLLGIKSPVVFGESGGKLLINGQPLADKEQKAAHVTGFVELMSRLGLNSLTFQNGLSESELTCFLEIVNESPEKIEGEGGLPALFDQKQIRHIVPGTEPAAVTPAGVADGAGDLFVPLMQTLETTLDPDTLARVFQELIKRISDVDVYSLAGTFIRTIDTEVCRNLFVQLITAMDNGRFQEFVEAVNGEAADPESAVARAHQLLMDSEPGKRYLARIQADQEAELHRKKQRMANLKDGLNRFLKGDTTPLTHPDVVASLPETIDNFMDRDKQATAEVIIEKLADQLPSTNPEIRRAVSGILVDVVEKHADTLSPEKMALIQKKFVEWLKVETQPCPAHEPVFDWLSQKAMDLYKNEEHQLFDEIFQAFSQIASSRIQTHTDIRQLAADHMKRIFSEEMIAMIIVDFQSKDPLTRNAAMERLVALGPVSAPALLELLKVSQDRFERVRILKLIPNMGDAALPALLEALEKGGPWYYIRNLVLLLGKIGYQDHLDLALPHLNHKDIRVQKETVLTVYTIGGDRSEGILLEQLKKADDAVKVEIVRYLGALESRDAVPVMIDLLSNPPSIPSKTRPILEEAICTALGLIGSFEAIPILTQIVQDEKKGLLGRKHRDEKVKSAAANALAIINGEKKRPENVGPPRRLVTLPPPEVLPILESGDLPKETETHIREQEARLQQLIEKQDTESAIKLLVDLVDQCAKARLFAKADGFRNQIQQLDEMALSELVKADECISKEKQAAMNPEYLEKWDALYATLSDEEKQVLYFSLKLEQFPDNYTIFTQGEPNTNLYFIETGELAFTCQKGQESLQIKPLLPGEIAGDESFFFASVATVTLQTLTPAKVTVLEKSMLERWKDTLPALEAKLKDYCLKQEKLWDILNANKLDRRQWKRLNLSGPVTIQVVDDSGQPIGNPLKGELSNISAFGIAFVVKTPKQETAWKLLARHVKIAFILPMRKQRFKIQQSGRVVSVTYQFENSFTVHMKLNQPIAQLMPNK